MIPIQISVEQEQEWSRTFPLKRKKKLRFPALGKKKVYDLQPMIYFIE